MSPAKKSTEFRRPHCLTSELRYVRRLLKAHWPSSNPLLSWLFDVSVDTRVPIVFFVLAVCAIAFSVVAKTDAISITFRNGSQVQKLRFGYLYEMNAGFFYLLIAPLFITSVITIMRRLETAMVHLSLREQLVLRDEKDMRCHVSAPV
jgi:hypothetical protein